MTCFDNIIGIKSHCKSIVSSSGLYVEDIGIKASECDYYISSDYKSGVELIIDKIRFAGEMVRRTISSHFEPSINTRSLIDSSLLGQYQDSLQMMPGLPSTLGGISITLNNTQSYFDLFVNEVSIQVDYAGDVPVFVYDLVSGSLIDTVIVPTVANRVSSVVVNKSYSSYKRKLDLIFVYDTENINSNNTILYSGCGHCSGYRYNNYYISSGPVYLNESSAKLRSSLTGGTHTFGLSINYSIQCSLDKWLCHISNQLAMPILYKAGELIMDYALLYSDRQNSSMNIDHERNKERQAAYISSYNECLQTTVGKIKLPKNDHCFFCNERVQSKIILP